MNKNSEEYFYLFSNGGREYFPENTLTNFANHFPVPLEVSKQYEVGIQAIGFSSRFKSVTAPPSGVPSLIITNCNNTNKYMEGLGITHKNEHLGLSQGPIIWSFNEDKIESCTEIDGIKSCKQQNCFYKYVTLVNREFNKQDIIDLCQVVSETKIKSTFKDNKLSFEIDDEWENVYGFHPCWIMMHETFVKSFGFEFIPTCSYIATSKVQNITEIMQLVRVGAATVDDQYLRTANYQGQKYYVYMIERLPGREVSLISSTIDMNKPQFPKTIKVVCENIGEQIYNSTYSKNMLVYTPDFNKLKTYTTQEIEGVDYMSLLNTSLKEMQIKLVDESDNLLHLLPGPATWIKMALRSIPVEKKSFNVVLTSQTSIEYKQNTKTNFRVKLPSPISLEGDWKVCVSSISHPTRISTFLMPEGEIEKQQFKVERSIGFQEMTTEGLNISEELLHTCKDNYAYVGEDLISELNNFLQSNDIGTFELDEGLVRLKVTKTGQFFIGYTLAKILGFDDVWHPEKLENAHVANFKLDANATYKFQTRFNIDYAKPKYIMIYADIIKPVLVAGEYKKLIRISPVEHSDLDYITNYFRHKEFCSLENTLVDSINIVLASHDGRQMYFTGMQDVIINLEFSNHPNN